MSPYKKCRNFFAKFVITYPKIALLMEVALEKSFSKRNVKKKIVPNVHQQNGIILKNPQSLEI